MDVMMQWKGTGAARALEMDRSFGGTGMDWTCVNTRTELELWEALERSWRAWKH